MMKRAIRDIGRRKKVLSCAIRELHAEITIEREETIPGEDGDIIPDPFINEGLDATGITRPDPSVD